MVPVSLVLFVSYKPRIILPFHNFKCVLIWSNLCSSECWWQSIDWSVSQFVTCLRCCMPRCLCVPGLSESEWAWNQNPESGDRCLRPLICSPASLEQQNCIFFHLIWPPFQKWEASLNHHLPPCFTSQWWWLGKIARLSWLKKEHL